MEFVLFEKLAKLEGTELIMLIVAAIVAIVLVVGIIMYNKRSGATRNLEQKSGKVNRTRAMVYGALCIALSFILSYIKIFSMPLGGSLTLCSMLPIALYASMFGPAYGFTAAFAYGVLQVIQGAWIVHPVQFILDYFVAFSCYGLAAFFPRSLPLGVGVAGISRMICSIVSGVVFFASSATDAGFDSAILYSFLYNASTIGLETLLCVIVAALPPVRSLAKRLKASAM